MVYLIAQDNNALFQQTGENIVRTFSTACLLNYYRYQIVVDCFDHNNSLLFGSKSLPF